MKREEGGGRRRGLLSLSREFYILSFQIVLATFWPRPGSSRTLRRIACLLSHNDIVNGNNTPAYRGGVGRHNG